MGKQIYSFLCVRPSVRAAFFLNPIRDCVFWHAQKLRILFVIIFARSPPKMHGQVRWSKFRSRDLTAKNTIVQSVGQKFRPRDLTAKKIPSCVRASGRPAVKIQIVIGVFGGTKNPEFRPDTFCAEHLQNARTCRYKPQKAFFWQQNFYKFWFLSKVRAIWHHTVTRVLSLGRPEFRRKFN